VLAYRAKVTPTEIRLADRIPVVCPNVRSFAFSFGTPLGGLSAESSTTIAVSSLPRCDRVAQDLDQRLELVGMRGEQAVDVVVVDEVAVGIDPLEVGEAFLERVPVVPKSRGSAAPSPRG
jgi:hypothetical protein